MKKLIDLTSNEIIKLKKLLSEVSDIIGDNVEFGKDLEIDGNLKINDLDNIVDKDNNKLLNFKTLFGNNNILGDGNIDIYRHFITLNSNLYLDYYSSNNIVCDSLQDLTTLTKAIKGTKITVGNTYITYNGSIWQTANSTNITTVTDNVTSI